MYFVIKFRILFNIISAIILIWTENRKEISKVLNQSKFYGSSRVKYSGFQNPGNLSLCTDPHLPTFPQENLLRFFLRSRGSVQAGKSYGIIWNPEIFYRGIQNPEVLNL